LPPGHKFPLVSAGTVTFGQWEGSLAMLDSLRVEMDAICARASSRRGSLPVGAVAGGSWGPCGPSSIVGLVGLLGMLICFPLAAIILLACGVRSLVRGLRSGPEGIA
jgi:hypothetical protein